MGNTVRAYFVPDNGAKPSTVNLPSDNVFVSAKKLGGFDMGEMPEFRIGDATFTFICDEEGFLTCNPRLTAAGIDITHKEIPSQNIRRRKAEYACPIRLVGPLIVLHRINVDEETGEETWDSLTDEELEILKSFTIPVLFTDGKTGYILSELEYAV